MTNSDRLPRQLEYLLRNPHILEAETIRRSFREFIKPAWQALEPDTPLLWNWHIDCLAEHLEAVSYGQINRLLINIPPRFLKSRICTTMWPCWEWTNWPHYSYLFSSYAQELSRDHSRDRRDIITSPWYQERWPFIKIRDDQGEIIHFRNTKGGTMFSRGTAGTSTGKGGRRVIVDDPHNVKKAESDKERETTLKDFQRNLNTRLNNPKTDAIVVVMQRLHEKDVSGAILKDIGGYTHLCLPLEAPRRTVIVFPRSGRKVTRKEGDLLHEARIGRDEMKTLKATMLNYAFSGQYQQDPIPRGENLFPADGWRFYDPLNPPHPLVTAQQWVQSWDMAFKSTKASAFVVGQVWCRWGANRFLIDQVRKRMSFKETIKAVIALSEKWPLATAKLIEDKANGPAVIDTLKDRVPGIIAWNPEGDKPARAEAYAVYHEAGNLWIPTKESTPWVEEFIAEHERCPNGEFWDQIDAAGQAMLYMRGAPINLDADANVAGDDYAGSNFDPFGLFSN